MIINGIIDLVANVALEQKTEYAVINRQRDVQRFSTQPTREGHVCIVGGGPSLADCVEQIRARKRDGAQIWATNNTFIYLRDAGIVPDVHVLLDSRPENLDFVWPTVGVTYYLSESCHPSLFDRLAANHVIIYDLGGAGTGTTVGLKALYLAGFSGYRNFHLFGMDSSVRANAHHAYAQPLNDGQELHDVTVDGRRFKAAAWMIYQAEEFQQIAASFAEQDCVITVAGDGLLPCIAHRLARIVRILTAVYDLAVSPPTYDFISFLGEAERRRLEIGAEAMDIIFMPGPIGGFRDDNLPPGIAEREGMLHRICVSACRLLPSVRNVSIRRERQSVDGEIFPNGWTVLTPVSHYGARYLKGSQPVLRSSEPARKFVSRSCRLPYLTITLRQSSYWFQRNSNLTAWKAAAGYIQRYGYDIIWVPDSESPDANAFSWDIDLRLALYEVAICNLAVVNGPTCLLYLSKAPYLVFKIGCETDSANSPEFLLKHGISAGDQFSANGRLIWEDDDESTIIREFKQWHDAHGLNLVSRFHAS